MSTRKFRKGDAVGSMHTLVDLFEAKEWVYYNHKVMHVGFWGSMPMRTLHGAVRQGRIYKAIRNEEESP